MAANIDPKLLERGWVHAHEEDSPGKVVFRPDTHALPPSRGRSGYQFQSGGRVVKTGPGPTDRRTAVQGTWKADPQGRLVISIPGKADEILEVEAIGPDRLVIKK